MTRGNMARGAEFLVAILCCLIGFVTSSSAPTAAPTFAPFTKVSAEATVYFKGLGKGDFSADHQTALKETLDAASDDISSTDEVTKVYVVAVAWDSGSEEIGVHFELQWTLEDTSYSGGSLLVENVESDIIAFLNDTNSSFFSYFTSACSTYDASTVNMTLDLSASISSVLKLDDSLDVASVSYTRTPSSHPTPPPSPSSTPSPSPFPTSPHHHSAGIVAAMIAGAFVGLGLGSGLAYLIWTGKLHLKEPPPEGYADPRTTARTSQMAELPVSVRIDRREGSESDLETWIETTSIEGGDAKEGAAELV